MDTRIEPVVLATTDGLRVVGRFVTPVPGPVPGAPEPRYAEVAPPRGQLPAFVVGHGFTGHSGQPRVTRISERLAAAGAPVLALDFRGHGGSDGASSVGVTETADVDAAVRWLRDRCPERALVVLGFSMGASIVVRHAGLGGDCDAVIAVSGPGRWFERGTRPMARLNQALETRVGRQVLRRFMKARIGPGWDRLPAAPVLTARGIGVPTLIVHGDADHYFDLTHPRMLAASVPGARLWIEPGMGHAENGTTDELLDRLLDWATGATGSDTMRG